MATNNNNRRSPVRTLNVNFAFNDHRITVVPMTASDLSEAADDIEVLDLPNDRTGILALKGFNLYNQAGDHFGRIFARGGVMTAEWYDDAIQNDWVLAKWNCRRLELGIIEILRLRDETIRPLVKVAEQCRREDYLAYLDQNDLALDEEGYEISMADARRLHLVPAA